MTTTIRMQARSSTTGLIYPWTAGFYDRLGTKYPGPGLPLDIDVRHAPRQSPPAPGILISGDTPIGQAQNSWKWDSKRFDVGGGGTYVIGDQMARLIAMLPDDCKYLDVRSRATAGAGASLGNTIDYAIGGVPSSIPISNTNNGPEQWGRIFVPGTGNRKVELYEQGCYITGLRPHTSAQIIPYAAHDSSVVGFGASGSQGLYSWNPLNFVPGVLAFILSWFGQVKTSKKFDACYLVATSGFGLQDYIASPSPSTALAWAAANVIARATGRSRKVAIFEFGAGDYFHAVWSAAQITTFYGYVADAVYSLDPTIDQLWKTMVVMGNPAEGTANAAGVTQQQMRNATAAIQPGRPFVRIATGYNGGATPAETTGTGDLQDNLHLTPVAQRDKAGPYMLSLL